MSQMWTLKLVPCPRFQKPCAMTLPQASSCRVLVGFAVDRVVGVVLLVPACNPLPYKMVGLIMTCESVRTMPHKWAHLFHTSSWQMLMSLLLLQLSPCSSIRPVPQLSHWSGRLMRRRLYLMVMLSSHSFLVSLVPENLSGIVKSHAPAAVARSIHFLTLGNDLSMRAVW